MADGATGGGGGFRGQRSRGVTTGPTRAAAVAAWGETIAREVRTGQSVLQQPQASPPPQGLPYERDGQKQGPNNFGGTRGLVLRTMAANKGYDDTRFATERTARDYNEMHGDGEQVRGSVVRGRKDDVRIPVPGQKGADEPRMVNVKERLAEDGPNYDVRGNQVEGKKGEVRRRANGEIVEKLVTMEGQRRGQGTVDYYNVDDLKLPSREPRAEAPQNRRDYLLADVMAKARRPVEGAPADSADPAHQPLQVRETKDLPGRAELSLEQNVDIGNGRTAPEAYVLRAGPEDSFPSKEHHVGALIHETNRFHMCRDGNADAIAVAKRRRASGRRCPSSGARSWPPRRPTMDRMTEVGYKWHPPQYSPENRRQVREAQAVQTGEAGRARRGRAAGQPDLPAVCGPGGDDLRATAAQPGPGDGRRADPPRPWRVRPAGAMRPMRPMRPSGRARSGALRRRWPGLQRASRSRIRPSARRPSSTTARARTSPTRPSSNWPPGAARRRRRSSCRRS